MEISEVRVRIVGNPEERLKAVCSVTFGEAFVVRDVKIVEGTSGLFVAMPSRKLSASCPKCRTQNHLRSRFCNECGAKLPAGKIPCDANGREKAHRDIAHPINAGFRQELQERVLNAYEDALEEWRDSREEEPAEERAVEPAEERAVEPAEEYAAVGKEDQDDDKESNDEPQDYDSLIADLRAKVRGERSESAPRPEAGGGQEREARGRRGGRGRGRRRDGERSGGDEKPRERKEPVEAVSKADSTPAASSSSGAREQKAPADDLGFGAGIVEEVVSKPAADAGGSVEVTQEAPRDQVDIKREVAEPQPSEDAAGDSAPFGAGLL